MTQPVLIIGGGWAGLSAAIELTRNHIPITLLDVADTLGGRARSVQFDEFTVDNGQHLLIGAYTHLLRLLDLIGVNTHALLHRLPLKLDMLETSGAVSLRAPHLPAPFHLLFALLNAKGISIKDKFSAIFGWRSMIGHELTAETDISVIELLAISKQPERITKALWEPLCLAALNTPIDIASAQIFQTIVKDTFNAGSHDSDLLIPKTDLGKLFPEPAEQYLRDNNGEIIKHERVTHIEISHTRISGINTHNARYEGQNVILAVPPKTCLSLIEPHGELHKIKQQIETYEYEPITTIYLRYPAETRLPSPMFGLLDSAAQWVFDRSLCHQNGLMSVVISSRGDHMGYSTAELGRLVHNELSLRFPHLPPPIQTKVIREKLATFSASAGINQYRPGNATPVSGLYLAGDYTDTSYPATLEGAVRSGISCADLIINHETNSVQ